MNMPEMNGMERAEITKTLKYFGCLSNLLYCKHQYFCVIMLFPLWVVYNKLNRLSSNSRRINTHKIYGCPNSVKFTKKLMYRKYFGFCSISIFPVYNASYIYFHKCMVEFGLLYSSNIRNEKSTKNVL